MKITPKPHHLILLLGVVIAGIAWPVYAQVNPPDIPHPLEGRDQCLGCHETGALGAPKVPDDHEGRTNETCQACHQPAEIPEILHLLEGREKCLACHATGAAGAPRLGESHEGRTEDQCLDCHTKADVPDIPHILQGRETCLMCHTALSGETLPGAVPPGPTPTIIPTPIPFPAQTGPASSCETCHAGLGGRSAEIIAAWRLSAHAKRDVSCADCHGGDPNASSQEAAMSEDAGFIGVPDRTQIPDLCGSCHSDVEQMRQFDLPTDQLAKYQESFHGQQLAKGDIKVATCFDCHGGHEIRSPNDPQSTVYQLNVPRMCANCHANEDYMAGYEIPTNQFDLYRDSVHGVALLEHQDTRSPSCATCHGTHGATPPGFGEVANVCGSCHEATQDYYLEGAHGTPGGGSPDCVACHGRYDVQVPGEYMFEGDEPRHCGECHSPDSEVGQVVGELRAELVTAAETYDQAEAAVQEAIGLGMLMSAQEQTLTEARTKLITARAAQHTVDVEVLREESAASVELSQQVIDSAEKAVQESQFRRQLMIIVLIVIGLIITSLVLLRRELVTEE